MKNSDEAWTTCTTAPPHRSSARRRDEYPNPGTLIEYWCAHAAVAGTGGAAMLTLVCARSLAKPGACLRSNWFQRWNLDETSRTRISEVRPAASSASANLPERASRGRGIRGASWPQLERPRVRQLGQLLTCEAPCDGGHCRGRRRRRGGGPLPSTASPPRPRPGPPPADTTEAPSAIQSM